ncbi:hypothetical protein HDU82_007913 [Entophlyctis luteolus]|nr:hypothetical protein HDU82_007913 [Entophlyctis luteolus]
MSLVSGLIPLSAKPATKAASFDDDFDVDDDDLDDLLGLDTFASPKPNPVTIHKTTDYTSKLPPADDDKEKPISRNLVSSQIQRPTPTIKYTLDPALTKKGAQDSVDEKSFGKLSVGDMDDMDDGLFGIRRPARKNANETPAPQFSDNQPPWDNVKFDPPDDSFARLSASSNRRSTTASPATQNGALDGQTSKLNTSATSKGKDVFGTEDLLASMGLDDKNGKAPNISKPSSETLLATKDHKSISWKSPGIQTVSGSMRSASPMSLLSTKSKDEEFIPSFLAEASGRRRRGPPPNANSVLDQSQAVDERLLAHKDPFDRQISKTIGDDNAAVKNSNTGNLMTAASSELKQSGDTNSISSKLSFLNPSPKLETRHSNIKAASSNQTMNRASSNSSNQINQPLSKTALDKQEREGISKSSSLSSLVSLSPSDNESDTSRHLKANSIVKSRRKKITMFSAKSDVRMKTPTSVQEMGPSSSNLEKAAFNESENKASQANTAVSKEKLTEISAQPAAVKSGFELDGKLNSDRSKDSESKQRISPAYDRQQITVTESPANQPSPQQKVVHDYAQDLKALQAVHDLEVGNILKSQKELMAEMVKAEVAKIQADYEKRIAELKSLHFDQMMKVISSTEAAQQLESLTHKVEDSTRMVDHMHQKLENDHAYSVKEREMALQIKERHLVEVGSFNLSRTNPSTDLQLQRQILHQHKELEEERSKLQQKSEMIENTLEDFRREREDYQRIADDQRKSMEDQMNVMRTEKDLIQRQLQRERIEFIRQKEAWSIDRKRVLLMSFDEQKELAMEKAIIDAKRGAAAEIEIEISKKKQQTEAKLEADRRVLEKEFHELSLQKAELFREAAALRSERFTLDAEKSKLSAELQVFEKGWQSVEEKAKTAKKVQASAGESLDQKEQKMENLEKEVKEALAKIQDEQRNLESARKHAIHEKALLSKTKERIVDDRISLAKERVATYCRAPKVCFAGPFLLGIANF